MSQLVYRTATKPLPSTAKTGIQQYTIVGESVGSNANVVAVSRSASNYYPHVMLQVSGSNSTNNWLAEMKVYTLPVKGS